jgi:RNA polymerase sigma-70 factor (ECF subfamily)
MSELISEIKKKNKDSVALLYRYYGKKLFGYARTKWKLEEDDSWEMVYKTLYKVMQVIDHYQFENENKFQGFVFTIFVNYLRNHYRDHKERKIQMVELTEFHERTGDGTDQGDVQKLSPQMLCLQKVLQTLDDWQRILLLMRAQDYSYEDIGNYVDRPTEQLKVYYMRLKKSVTEKTNECINQREI